jgi:hypothetical protein
MRTDLLNYLELPPFGVPANGDLNYAMLIFICYCRLWLSLLAGTPDSGV